MLSLCSVSVCLSPHGLLGCSELCLIPGLRITGRELVAAAALPTLGAAAHVGQGVGADEVPVEDTKEGSGTTIQVASHTRPVPAVGSGAPRQMLGGPVLCTHTMSLGSSLVSGGGLMST